MMWQQAETEVRNRSKKPEDTRQKIEGEGREAKGGRTASRGCRVQASNPQNERQRQSLASRLPCRSRLLPLA